jgi:hypothetical protein
MADEFPRAEVIGIDIAPLQPECGFHFMKFNKELTRLLMIATRFHHCVRTCLISKQLFKIMQSNLIVRRFELWDLDEGIVPYNSNYFDLVHARSINWGVSNIVTMSSVLSQAAAFLPLV